MTRSTQLLLFFVGALVFLGLVTLGTSSSVRAMSSHGDSLHYLFRQWIWLGVAVVAFIGACAVPHHLLKFMTLPMFVGTIALLIAVMFTDPINGARRWLSLGPFSFQPSELAKFTTILMVSWWMAKKHHRSARLVEGLLVPGCMVAVLAGMVFIEPDYGTTMLICAVGGILMFLAGTRIVYLMFCGIVALLGFIGMIMTNPTRAARVFAWLSPMEHQSDEGLQLVQSLQAFQRGGIRGVGPGETQQTFYLPEAHTDFIFPITGEAFGMLGSLAALLLFVGVFLCGIRISASCKETFGRLLGYGITFVITFQAMINMMVVTGILPTKGIALPFMSYGGSHLVVSGGMLGVLFSIALYNNRTERDSPYERTRDEFY